VKFYDAFCGIGGFRLGLQRAGHTCIGECDNSPTAKKIYARHFGDWPEGDIRDVDGIPPCDLFCGGFPCPSFSVAGKGLGLEDPRGELFFEMCRLIKGQRPKLLLLENVKGLLSHDRGRTYAVILSALEELGYDVQWQVLNSKYWIPQNRERVFIIGSLREKTRPEIFPLIEGKGILGPKNNGKQKEKQGIRSQIVSTIDARYGALRNAGETYLIAWSKSNRGGGKTEARVKVGEANTLVTGTGCGGTSSMNYIIEPSSRIRRLTPLECERLQGFPDNWTKGLSDSARYEHIGNAVTVGVIEEIGIRIKKYETECGKNNKPKTGLEDRR